MDKRSARERFFYNEVQNTPKTTTTASSTARSTITTTASSTAKPILTTKTTTFTSNNHSQQYSSSYERNYQKTSSFYSPSTNGTLPVYRDTKTTNEIRSRNLEIRSSTQTQTTNIISTTKVDFPFPSTSSSQKPFEYKKPEVQSLSKYSTPFPSFASLRTDAGKYNETIKPFEFKKPELQSSSNQEPSSRYSHFSRTSPAYSSLKLDAIKHNEPIRKVSYQETIKPIQSIKTNLKEQPTISLIKSSDFLNTKNLTKLKRGMAIIFNHEKYDYRLNLSKRTGTNRDVDNLKITLEKFNIDVQVKQDLKLSEIEGEVKKLCCFSFTPFDCFVIIILTHGNIDNILYAYDEKYNLDEKIINPIINTNKTLLGKPKIVFIQACRGKDELISFIETDSISRNVYPPQSNLFCAFATYEGFVSYRDTVKGGLFIQKLCEKLKIYGSSMVIEKIMHLVTDELSRNDKTQVPTIRSTMTTSFCFGDIGK